MGLVVRRLSLPLILIFLAQGSISCSRPHADGTQHTGGGVTLSSKVEDVEAALDLAIRLATDTDEQKNIFVQFWKTKGQGGDFTSKASATHLFPDIQSGVIEQAGKFSSPSLQAFKHNTITRLVSGDCPQAIPGKHADASVSDLSSSATICFSVGNLSRLSPSVLLREILSLVLHEASHMGGAQEPEAIAWQEAFSAYFGERFGEVDIDTVSPNTFKGLSEIRVILARAEAMAESDPKNPHIFAIVGKMAEKIASLPNFDDPLALELKTHPAHPELIDNYSNAVKALIAKIEDLFESQHTIDLKNPFRVHVPFEMMPPEMIVPTLNGIEKDLDQIAGNFLAFTEAQSDVESVCILPEKEVDVPSKPNFIVNQQTYGASKRCAQEY